MARGKGLFVHSHLGCTLWQSHTSNFLYHFVRHGWHFRYHLQALETRLWVCCCLFLFVSFSIPHRPLTFAACHFVAIGSRPAICMFQNGRAAIEFLVSLSGSTAGPLAIFFDGPQRRRVWGFCWQFWVKWKAIWGRQYGENATPRQSTYQAYQ